VEMNPNLYSPLLLHLIEPVMWGLGKVCTIIS
jgi:hypothetical protein